MQWMMTPIKINYRFIKIDTKPLPILECIQIVLSIMIHFLCMDMENSHLRGKYNIKGLIKLFCLMFTTTCFPSIVGHILKFTWNLNQPQPHLFNMPNGRALPLIHVGIKYGVLIYYFDIQLVIFGVWFHHNVWLGRSYSGEPDSERKFKRQLFGDSLLHMISMICGNDALDKDDAKNGVLEMKRLAYFVLAFLFWNLNLLLTLSYMKLIDQIVNMVIIVAFLFSMQVFFMSLSEVGGIVGMFLVRTLNGFASNNIGAQQRLIVGPFFFFLWMCTMGVVILL